MRRKSKLVCGVGINDADYIVQPTVNGKRVNCVFYIEWVGMISRCYNEKKLSRVNTYKKCFVCDEWLTFSSFKEWMKNQDYKGNHLDKDILLEGNKIYSPNTCAFVKRSTNNLLNDRGNHRGKYPLGSHLNKNSGKLVVRCKDGKGKQIYLGGHLRGLPRERARAPRHRPRRETRPGSSTARSATA